MMKKSNRSCKKAKKMQAVFVCIAEAIIFVGSTTACMAAKPDVVPQQALVQNEAGQEQTTFGGEQQNVKQPVQNADGQISLDEAKNAALKDAGLDGADVKYTKEKLDYEDGIVVYDVEFYADNVEYEYEINAVTGAVYSKSVETHQDRTGLENTGHAENAETYIDIDSAKTIALDHAGFSEKDVSHLKIEFDMEDGIAVYEVEFDMNGSEYEYVVRAADGLIAEYDVD